MKDKFDKVSDVVSGFFKEHFRNRLVDAFTQFKETILDPLDEKLASPFESINNQIDTYTTNDYQGLKDLFGGRVYGDTSLQASLDALEASLGKAQNFADNYKIGPFTLGRLATIAESASLQGSLQNFRDHTDALSGVKSTMAYDLITLYGNVASIGATANVVATSNVVTPNLNSTAYPRVDYGDTIIIGSQTRLVVEKKFTAHATGTVSVDVATNNVKVTTASVGTLNLANCLLSPTNTLNLNTSMFITVNGDIRRIESINAAGDFLLVDLPFDYSATAVALFKETTFVVNTAFTTSNTNQTVFVKTPFVCNTECLDTVITGNGTSWNSQLAVGDKIIYDTQEFIIESLTNTTITVDGQFRLTKNFAVYKVNNEIEIMTLGEDTDPDEIINGFTMIETMTGDPNFMKGVKSRVRLANGKYQSVATENPIDAVQSLFKKELISDVKNELKRMKYELNQGKTAALSNTAINTQMQGTINRFYAVKNELEAVIARDKQIIKNVKNFVSALGKLFSLSCGKKKKKKGDSSSDDYLDVITVPYPVEDGCDATTGQFITILDDFDSEFNEDGFVGPTINANTSIATTNQFDGSDVIIGPLPNQIQGTGTGEESNVGIDGTDPNVNVPEDPCAKPC